jgi:hypothetical protein
MARPFVQSSFQNIYLLVLFSLSTKVNRYLMYKSSKFQDSSSNKSLVDVPTCGTAGELFSLILSVETGSENYPVFYLMSTGRIVKLTIHPHVVS